MAVSQTPGSCCRDTVSRGSRTHIAHTLHTHHTHTSNTHCTLGVTSFLIKLKQKKRLRTKQRQRHSSGNAWYTCTHEIRSRLLHLYAGPQLNTSEPNKVCVISVPVSLGPMVWKASTLYLTPLDRHGQHIKSGFTNTLRCSAQGFLFLLLRGTPRHNLPRGCEVRTSTRLQSVLRKTKRMHVTITDTHDNRRRRGGGFLSGRSESCQTKSINLKIEGSDVASMGLRQPFSQKTVFYFSRENCHVTDDAMFYLER